MNEAQFLRVAVPTPLRRLFDYLPPLDCRAADIAPGTRVLVPFGSRRLIGIAVGTAGKSDVPAAKLKRVAGLPDQQAVFSPAVLRLLRWAAEYYHHPLGEALATALPVALRDNTPLWPVREMYRINEAMPPADAAAMLARARRQRALFEWVGSRGECDRAAVAAAGFDGNLLRHLLDKRLVTSASQVCPVPPPFAALVDPPADEPQLNDEQREAVARIHAAGEGFHAFLLDGITGAGKTEVYMRAMTEQLLAGRQCLLLVPEIGLTSQTIRRFEARFPVPVVALHSGLNDRERLVAWRQAVSGAAGIVIGTRSAVFTPLAKPGVIIVDEEHDSSFKQQDGFRYSARDLAVARAREEDVGVVLGSATPALESLRNAQLGKFSHLRLTKPAGAASICRSEIVATDGDPRRAGLSEPAVARIDRHLKDGNQVLVFVNRRGYAPILNCQQCAWVSECRNCVAQMTVHATPPALRCHHCGVRASVPRTCPTCGSAALSTRGVGTQQLEEYLKARFGPGSGAAVPVLRVDRDSVPGRRQLERLFAVVRAGGPCIVLGTQMLAKGHHFPNITLAVIVNADSGLFSADFRGREYMSQMVFQVAGRAGRAERPGEVIIQSQYSAHPAVQSLALESYGSIAGKIMADREKSLMPPFSYLALIRCEARSLRAALACLHEVKQSGSAAPGQEGVRTIGPLPAPMEKRNGRMRAQLLLRARTRRALRQRLTAMAAALEELKTPAGLRWAIDVDPTDLI